MASALLQVLVWAIFFGVLILWPAGSLAYPGGWAFIVLFVVGGGVITIWMARHSPELLRERLSSPVQRGQALWDRIFLVLFIALFIGWLALMGWDAGHTGFAAVPLGLQVAGGLGLLVYGVLAWLAFRENAFAAPVVKVTGTQKLIDTGPYAVVRHPMYAGALFLFIGLPLLLGSWMGLIGSVLFIFGIAWRSVREERSLRTELPGYDDYLGRVRWRFVPGIW